MRQSRDRHPIFRGLVLGAVISSATLALVVSCSFPDVTFAPVSGEGGIEAGAGESSTSDVSNDVQVLIDGGDPDALIVKDAGGRIDAAGCLTCDCDNDGFNRGNCDAGPDAGPVDCDDNDTRTKPGQGYLIIPAEPPRNGDWNCVNNVEKFYTPNIDCTKVSPGATCDGTFGFSDDPACGSKGTFVTCKTAGGIGPILASCVVGSKTLMDTTQGCK